MTPSVNLLIAGAQRAGTSSLLRYLAQHPNMCTHMQSEMNYFVNEKEFQAGFATAYARYFLCQSKENLILVAKSVGISDSTNFIKRVFNHNPGIHIAILIRNPVDRAYSAFWFARRKGWEPLDNFESAIEAGGDRFAADILRQRECAYLSRGIYIKQIRQLLKYFPAEQIHVFLLEDIQQNAFAVCQSLYKACGLSADFAPDVTQYHNISTVTRSTSLAQLMSSVRPVKRALRHLLPDVTADKIKQSLQSWNQKQGEIPQMKRCTRKKLLAYYQPFNYELSLLLKRDLSHWNQ